MNYNYKSARAFCFVSDFEVAINMHWRMIVTCALLAMISTVRSESLQPCLNENAMDVNDIDGEAKCAACKATADALKSFVNSEDMIELEKKQIKKICHHIPVFKKVVSNHRYTPLSLEL
ncbi:hypothetical protein FGIG_09088 [Fasciola gigantica]|uniref:Saposin B-type domain-containing protein n=1 Tax=Fasciola gigantica TaxID=46835 RepID=A0A504ZE94_FASGI|nr:hypothetical protein FGIG_09088 [Fasciola gigantica]